MKKKQRKKIRAIFESFNLNAKLDLQVGKRSETPLMEFSKFTKIFNKLNHGFSSEGRKLK